MTTHDPRRRVVVTGMGTTSPVGGDVATTWDALVKGQSGVRHLDDDWAAEAPVKIAGRIAVEPSEVLERVKARRLDRSSQFAMVAAMEAWADSGLDRRRPRPRPARRRDGVRDRRGHDVALQLRHPSREGPAPGLPARRADADAERAGGPDQPLRRARAAVNTPVSACASGNEAISLALDQIRLGRADIVLAGGTEAAIHPLPMAAFANMMALSKNTADPTTVSRPWDTARDGFVLGEGAGVLVLESEEHARGARGEDLRRGARRRHHRRRPRHRPARPRGPWRRPRDPAGAGGVRTSTPSDIVHINAHATSTPQGDIAEGLMIHATLGVARRRGRGHQHQVDDRAPARRRRRARGDRHGAGDPPPGQPAHDQPRRQGPRRSSSTSRPRRATCPSGDIAALNNSFGFGGANVAVAFGSV